MSNSVLNEYGLVGSVGTLIRLIRKRTKLKEELEKAEKANVENEQAIQALRCTLGAHTQETGRPEVVLSDGLAAFIPVPKPGGPTTEVEVIFSTPRKLP